MPKFSFPGFTTAVLFVAIALSGIADAQALKVTPGEWETVRNISVKQSVGGRERTAPPRLVTTRSCVKLESATLKPADLAMDGCVTASAKTSGAVLSFYAVCMERNVEMKGSMSFTSRDGQDEGVGEIALIGIANGSIISMDGTITSKRIGDCS